MKALAILLALALFLPAPLSAQDAAPAEIHALRDRLIELRLLVEATLDFPEEEIDFLEQADARGRLAAVAHSVDTALSRARQGALLREGITVVLAGQPNVGKSSLLNALAGAELAIVTPVPGTTRDKVGQSIQIEGIPVHVVDTAGLRETNDEVERIGVERSWQAIAEADAVLFIHDLTRLDEAAYQRSEEHVADGLPAALRRSERLLHVFNKVDARPRSLPDEALGVSARTGEGLDRLRQRLLALAGWHAQPDGVFIARTRHVQALRRTRQHLLDAAAQLARKLPALDLLAEDLRLAHDALGEITGVFTADDLLGEIFGRFCIGK